VLNGRQQFFSEHFGANNAILRQIVQNLLRAKLCAIFSKPCIFACYW